MVHCILVPVRAGECKFLCLVQATTKQKKDPAWPVPVLTAAGSTRRTSSLSRFLTSLSLHFNSLSVEAAGERLLARPPPGTEILRCGLARPGALARLTRLVDVQESISARSGIEHAQIWRARPSSLSVM